MSENALAVPDYLKDMLSQASLDNLASAASSSGTSFPRISLKGRTFRFKNGEEEVKTSRNAVDVIILGVSPDKGAMRKTLYLANYDPNSADPPDCSSTDGIRPDSHVGTKQAELCAHCRYNQWGSDTSMSGKKSKKCRDSKVAFVVDAADPDGPVYALTITVASLRAFSEYAQLLLKNQVPFAACITRLDFTEADFPQLSFQHMGIMKQEACVKMLARAEKAEWQDQLALVSNTPDAALPAAAPVATPAAPQQVADTTQAVETVKTTTDVDSVLDSWAN